MNNIKARDFSDTVKKTGYDLKYVNGKYILKCKQLTHILNDLDEVIKFINEAYKIIYGVVG